MSDGLLILILCAACAALMPLYMVNQEAPTITRAKALAKVGKKDRLQRMLLERFWTFYFLTTLLSIAAMAVIMLWTVNPRWMNILAVSLFVINTIFQGVLVSMPMYVTLKRWKANAQRHSGH